MAASSGAPCPCDTQRPRAPASPARRRKLSAIALPKRLALWSLQFQMALKELASAVRQKFIDEGRNRLATVGGQTLEIEQAPVV